MSFTMARHLTAHLIALAMIFQGVELLKMIRQGEILKVWSAANLEEELRSLIPFGFASYFARAEALTFMAYTLIAVAIVAFLHPASILFFILFFAHLLVCVRFRGSLNGGSDAMTAVVLLGIWIAYVFKKESAASAGLIWISVNLLLSYGRAGLAKIRHSDWKDGRAVPAFLRQSFYEDARALGARLSVPLAKQLGWFVILIEFALVLSPLASVTLLNGIFLVVILFHFANFWAFGLNRFFWAWIAAWPSIYFLSGFINHV